jgi:hypothetical protein
MNMPFIHSKAKKKRTTTMAKKKIEETIHIAAVAKGHISVCVVGTTGFLHNRLPMKARQQLLMPSAFAGRKKSGRLKHEVEEEYQGSPYLSSEDKSPTYVQMVGSAFRQAMQSAALEIPGVTKAQTGRLIWVEDDRIDIYGKPFLHMAIVRQAGINKTPDVRTRAFMPRWAAVVNVAFIEPQFTAEGVVNLLSAAGTFIGVGDGRNEKGALNHGLWRICGKDDPEFKELTKKEGRKLQTKAFKTENIELYDEETRELYEWWVTTKDTHKSLHPAKSNGVSKKKTKVKSASASLS